MIDSAILQQVLAKVGLYSEICFWHKLHGGRQHSAYQVKLVNNNRYVIKQLKIKCYLGEYNQEHFNNTEHLAAYINKYLLCSAVAIKPLNTQDYIVEINGEIYLVFPFYVSNTSSKSLSGEQCCHLGVILADIHHLPAPNIKLPIMPTTLFNIENWSILLDKYLTASELQLIKRISDNCNEAQHYKKKLVLSHRDINYENILWLSDLSPLLIDWESAGWIEPGVELLGLALNMSGITTEKIQFKKLVKVFNGYKCRKNNIDNLINIHTYYRSYTSWFSWLDYCLLNINSHTIDYSAEIRITINAILKMHKYQKDILQSFFTAR